MATVTFMHKTGLIEQYDVPDGALMPVVCRFCRAVYDLASVHVTNRHADCSVYRTPCCDRQADDREWKITPDFQKLNMREAL